MFELKNLVILAFIVILASAFMNKKSIRKMSNLEDPMDFNANDTGSLPNTLEGQNKNNEMNKFMEMQKQNAYGCTMDDYVDPNGSGGEPMAQNSDYDIGASVNSVGNNDMAGMGNNGNGMSALNGNGGNGMNGNSSMNGNGMGNGMGNGNSMNGMGNGNGNSSMHRMGNGGLMQGNGMGVPGIGPDSSALGVEGQYNNNSDFPEFPSDQLEAGDLLPQETGTMFSDLNPNGDGPLNRNFLTSSYHIGIDTVGQSLRNANKQIRAEPPNPQVVVSPWNNTTMTPDLSRKPMEGLDC